MLHPFLFRAFADMLHIFAAFILHVLMVLHNVSQGDVVKLSSAWRMIMMNGI